VTGIEVLEVTVFLRQHRPEPNPASADRHKQFFCFTIQPMHSRDLTAAEFTDLLDAAEPM
jgi:hypothetical protein